MKSLIPVIVLLGLQTPVAMAQDFLPAPDLVEETLRAHPMSLAADGQIAAARGEARRQAAGEYEWTLEGGYSSRDISQEGRFDEFEISAARPVRLPGKAELDRSLGQAGIISSQAQAAMARHELSLELAGSWMDWLEMAELARIDTERVASFQQALDAAEVQRDTGRSAELDVELAASALADAEMTARRSQGDAAAAAARLDARFPELIRPARAPDVPAPEALDTARDWMSDYVAVSPALASLQADMDRLEAQSRRSRAELRPDPELGVRAFSERGGDELGLGVFVSIPIGGATRSASSDRDLALARSLAHEAAAIRREVEAEARQASILAIAEFEAWQAASRALENSASVIARMRHGFEIGAVDLPALLLAEQRHGDVQSREVEARLRAQRAQIELRLKAGDLWSSMLK